MRWKTNSESELSCSFCHKAQHNVGKLISSPSDYPRAYICNECIAVCSLILEDDRGAPPEAAVEEPETPHPLLAHPLASELMEAVSEWIRQESLSQDASEELARLRDIAERAMRS